MTTVEKLLELKEQIQTAKEEKAKLEGKLQSIKEQLKNEYKCNSISDAEILLEQLSEEIKVKEKELDKGMEELDKEFDDE